MPRVIRWRPLEKGRIFQRARGVDETTERVRQLVDGLERAVISKSDLELSSYLATPALGFALACTSMMRSAGAVWLPARAGLRWTSSDRAPEGPGRFWIKLRFEDRTVLRSGSTTYSAAAITHEVEVELDTTSAPWRLCQAYEHFVD